MGVLDKFLERIKLNDDIDDDGYLDEDMMDEEDEDDDFLDDESEGRVKKSFFQKFSGKKRASDDDEDEEEDFMEPEEEQPVKVKVKEKPASAPKNNNRSAAASKSAVKTERTPKTSSKITPMRSSRRNGQPSSMEVCVIKPTSMEDSREIADTLVDNCTVILNLEGLDMELAQRIIDFTSGACYSLNGTLQQISSYIFVLGPYNVEITGDLRSILGGAVPSVRAGY